MVARMTKELVTNTIDIYGCTSGIRNIGKGRWLKDGIHMTEAKSNGYQQQKVAGGIRNGGSTMVL